MHFVELEAALSEDEARTLGLVLASAAVIYRLRPASHEDPESAAGDHPLPARAGGVRWSLAVASRQVDQARALIAEERANAAPDEGREPAPEPQLGATSPLAWVVGLILVNVGVWQALEHAGGSTRHDVLKRFGAITTEALQAGEWWRVLTAVFLHIGSTHLVANSMVLLVLGYLALRSWGPGRMLFVYLAAGGGGNIVGYLWGDPLALKAGASGAILGLLGGLAGARLRALVATRQRSRYRLWHIPAMVLAFYGLVIGVSPESDHPAHLGGLLTGALITLVWPRPGRLEPRGERALQLALGGLAIGASALAGYAALRQ